MTHRQMVVLGGLVTFCLLGLGVLVGIVTERIRFDGARGEILAQLEHATRAQYARMMAPERDVRTPSALPGAPAATGLEAVDEAIRSGDIAAAERAWRDAHGVATMGREWRPLADIGDAALRIGDAAGQRAPYVSRAREAYLAALVRARADRSREGVTRIRHAFRVLGDHDLAQQCAIIADNLPVREHDAAPVRGRSVSATRAPWSDQ
jgi:hypothetical protein